MGFNYGLEKKNFDRQWAIMRKQYEDAGMSIEVMLYQIFQKAEANDLVRRNPVRLAEKMRASGTAKRKEAFTTEEVPT